MADRVIIVGSKRGDTDIDAIELKQICGRAGRNKSSEAIVDFIVYENQIQELEKRLFIEPNINSSLDKSIHFHLLAELYSGCSNIENWWKRSLAYYQTNIIPDFDNILKELEELNMIRGTDITPLGEITVGYYFCPFTTNIWNKNFEEIILDDNLKDIYIAWALSSVSYYSNYNSWGFANEYKDYARSYRLRYIENTELYGQIFFNLLRGRGSAKKKQVVNEVRRDFGRIHQFLLKLNDINKWRKQKFFDELLIRIRKGVEEELVWFCKLGFSKSMAFYLREIGCENEEDIIKHKEIADDDVRDNIKKVLRC